MIQFLSYTVKEAIEGIKANKEAYLITIGTTAISMTIFGIFLIIFFNLEGMVKEWRDKFQIIIYLKNDVLQKDLDLLKKLIDSKHEIDNFQYVPKEKALKKFRKRLNQNQTILDNLDVNPLPASFELQLKKNYRDFNKIESIVKEVDKVKGVESVEFGGEWLERVETILFFLKFFVLAIGGLIGVGIIFIISNAIRLSLYARKDEIEIMQLVGATDKYIKAPFLLEGILQGFLGVVFSLAILYVLNQMFIGSIQSSSFFIGYQSFLFIPTEVINYMILSGIFIGCLGSYLSLGKFLKK